MASFYLISGILFILALRGLSKSETSRQGKHFKVMDANCRRSRCRYFYESVILEMALTMF